MTKHSSAGRSVSVLVRMTESGLKYIDDQRGDLPRAEFIRRVLAEHAGTYRPEPPKPVDPEEFALVMNEVLDASGYRIVRK